MRVETGFFLTERHWIGQLDWNIVSFSDFEIVVICNFYLYTTELLAKIIFITFRFHNCCTIKNVTR